MIVACVCACVCVPGYVVTPTDQGTPPGEVDAIYQVLKQAGEISTNRTINPRNSELLPARRAQQPPLMLRGNTTLNVGPTPHASSSGLT